MSIVVRPASVTDAEAMLDLYAPIVRETAISFEWQPPSLAEFRERIVVYMRTAPWLLCDINGSVTGYAYAAPFRARSAYQWTAEVTVYVATAFQRRGVARALYQALLAVLALQGYHSAVGVIVLPNPASVGLHEHLGFTAIGTFPRVGFKLGQWRDTGWWMKALVDSYGVPNAILALPQLDASCMTTILDHAASGVRPGR